MAGRPFTQANPVGSLKVRRTLVTSPKVTTRSPLTFTGRPSTSCALSNRPGTLTAKRPSPVSRAPAATRRLLRWMKRMSSS